MIKSRKSQLAIILTLACICLPLLSAEPKEAKTEVKFEINKDIIMPWISDVSRRAMGPVKATHVALFYITRPNLSENLPTRQKGIPQILNTSVGNNLSENQRNLLIASDAINRFGEQEIRNHDKIMLYGVSEEETKWMVRAYLELANNEANKETQYVLNEQQERKEKIADIKKKLPEKQKKLDEAKSKYKEIKNSRYFSLTDSQIYTKAKELMLEMDKMLDTLEIELAGIREKLKSIEQYRRRKSAENAKHFSKETLDKLDQMYVEQMIELSSAKARQQAAFEIRKREKEFLNVFNQWSNLEGEVSLLKGRLEDHEHNLRQAENKLANPTSEMRPPKVYLNKVTIYPVKYAFRNNYIRKEKYSSLFS